MTRRSLRIVIAALSSLFAFATSASAECAWVLWQQLPNGSGVWSLDEGREIAFPTKPKCEKRLKARAQAFAQATTGPRPFLVCLPNTVDPRGAKGK